jgi:hypothetical protein
MDLAIQKRRLALTIAINALSVLIAVAAAVGALGYHVGWLIWIFGAALCAGFAAQSWLIVGLLRGKPS